MVVYSPVCDNNPVVYLAYLSVLATGDVSSSLEGVSQVGRSDDHEGRCGGVGDGGAAIDVFRGFYDKAKSSLDGVGVGDAPPGVSDYVRNVIGFECGRAEDGSVGVASVHDVDCDSGVDDSVSVGDSSVTGDGETPERVPVEDVAVSSGVSAGTLLNRERRQKAKLRKQRKKERQAGGEPVGGAVPDPCPKPVVPPVVVQSDDVPQWRRRSDEKPGQFVARVVTGEDVDGELKASVKRKWAAKNKLEALKAEREVAVLEANSVDAEIARYRTMVLKQSESNKVSIERVHAKLRMSGNVTEDDESRVHTVVSTPSMTEDCAISPDSSASQSEVRAIQKKLLDLEAAVRKMGLEPDCLGLYDKQVWTENEANDERLDRMYPHGFSKEFDCESGKFMLGQVFDTPL